MSRLEQSVQRVSLGAAVGFFSGWALVSLSSNLLGAAGGMTSDVLVSAFGLGAWVGAVLGLFATALIFRGRYGALRAVGDVAIAVSASSLASIVRIGAGGWAGDTFGLSVQASIGTLGAAIFFLLLSLIVVAERAPLRSVARMLGGVGPRGGVRAPSFGLVVPPLARRVSGGGADGMREVDTVGEVDEVDEADEADEEDETNEMDEEAQAGCSPISQITQVAQGARGARGARVASAAPIHLPAPSLLAPASASAPIDEGDLREQASVLEGTLGSYGVEGKVESWVAGPTVVTFDAKIAAGTKMSKVVGLADDLALAFGRKVRISAGSRPGRLAFEVERSSRASVGLRELLEDSVVERKRAALPIVLGRGLRGEAVVADLAEMPHMIVAGATGSGKSVCLNSMLCSLLMSRGPDELRLVLVDPKVVELAPYGSVPHMLVPVVTDAGRAMSALGWAVAEMERRYAALAKSGCKNLAALNKKARPGERMAHIVIVVDEFADLMAQQGKAAEAAIGRLAQKARAAGIHLVLATQRPSVDVVTGTIKANFPARIALRVAQRTDSRTILDEQGAEHLAGRGDMLCKLGGSDALVRVQCPMVSDDDVEVVCGALSSQARPVFDESVFSGDASVDEAKVWS